MNGWWRASEDHRQTDHVENLSNAGLTVFLSLIGRSTSTMKHWTRKRFTVVVYLERCAEDWMGIFCIRSNKGGFCHSELQDSYNLLRRKLEVIFGFLWIFGKMYHLFAVKTAPFLKIRNYKFTPTTIRIQLNSKIWYYDTSVTLAEMVLCDIYIYIKKKQTRSNHTC